MQRIGGHFQPEPAQGERDLGTGQGLATGQRLEEHVAERRGETAQVAVDDLAGRDPEDLLGPAVERADAVIPPDRHHAARHALEDLLAELLLALEPMM